MIKIKKEFRYGYTPLEKLYEEVQILSEVDKVQKEFYKPLYLWDISTITGGKE